MNVLWVATVCLTPTAHLTNNTIYHRVVDRYPHVILDTMSAWQVVMWGHVTLPRALVLTLPNEGLVHPAQLCLINTPVAGQNIGHDVIKLV